MHKNLDRSHAKVKKATGTRSGRGFSPFEIKDAGLTIQDLYKHKLAIDKRRKSAHKDNIDFLTTLQK